MLGQAKKTIRERWGATVTATEQISTQASTREYFRLSLSGNIALESVVLARFGPGIISPNSDELYAQEEDIAPAYNRYRELTELFTRAKINVPEILSIEPNEQLLILEDLGDFSLFNAIETIRELEDPYSIEKLIQKALLFLIQIQNEGTRLQRKHGPKLQMMDERLLQLEFVHFIDNIPIKVGNEIETERDRLLQRLASLSPVLCHRDYHPWNIMVSKGKMWIVDFQDAILAPPHYDLISLLRDRNIDEYLPEGAEERLVEYYLQQVYQIMRQKTPRENFKQEYLMFSLQRDLKVIGRFNYLVGLGKTELATYLPRVISRARDTAREISTLPCLADLLDELAKKAVK